MAFLRNQNVRHDNICPETILLCNGKYKLNHPDLLHSTPDNFEKMRSSQNHHLSPEGIRAIGNKAMVDGSISDIYSLGLTMLEACTLKTEQNFYLPDGSANKPLIQNKVLEANKVYQASFVELIIRMLSIDHQKRVKMYDYMT